LVRSAIFCRNIIAFCSTASGLPGGLQRLVVQTLEVLDACSVTSCAANASAVVVFGGLACIACCDGLIGQRQRLAHVDLQLRYRPVDG
jgi:hypothetical protein